MVAAMIGEPDPLTDSLVAAQARFGRSIYSCLGAQAPRPQQEGLHRACTRGVSPLQLIVHRCLGCAATCNKLARECSSVSSLCTAEQTGCRLMAQLIRVSWRLHAAVLHPGAVMQAVAAGAPDLAGSCRGARSGSCLRVRANPSYLLTARSAPSRRRLTCSSTLVTRML